MSEERTYGEKIVRTGFNPSGDPVVAEIKARLAKTIDLVRKAKPPHDGPMAHHASDPLNGPPGGTRAASIAIQKLEEAAMWAIKAVTEEIRAE